jgi:Zn-dependent metalloprotease
MKVSSPLTFRVIIVCIICQAVYPCVVTASNTPAATGSSQYRTLPGRIVDSRFGTTEVLHETGHDKGGTGSEAKALRYFSRRSAEFGIKNPSEELKLSRTILDPLGKSHYRFEQVYRGLRIWGCTKDAHFDSSGAIYLTAGQNVRTPEMSVVPRVDSTRAEREAHRVAFGATGNRPVKADIELLIYAHSGAPRLAWLVTFVSAQGGGIRYRVFVDAQSGEILHHFNDLHFDGPTLSSGTDLDGFSRTLHTYEVGTHYQLIDASRPMYQPPVGDLQGVIVTYWNKHRFGGVVVDSIGSDDFSDAPGYQAAVSAHFFAEQV